MSIPDNSTQDSIVLLYNGLVQRAISLGLNYQIVLGEWKVPFTQQSKPIIGIIPKYISVGAPMNPNGDDLQKEVLNCEIKLWAPNYDGLYFLRSFFRQYTQIIFKGWCEFDDVVFDPFEQAQYGAYQTWIFRLTSTLPSFTQLYTTTIIQTVSGSPADPPVIGMSGT